MTPAWRAGRAGLRFLVVLVAGCTTVAEGPGFTASVEPPVVALVNRDSAPVYFTVFEHQMAMVVRWAPCREPSECPSVPAGSELRLPFDSIAGYHPGATAAILYWYQLRADSAGGTTYDSVRSINLSLADTAR